MGLKKKIEEGRAAEIREQAREVAGQSGEALKDFAESTGSAAKDFATKTRDAAKELVEAIERAAKHAEPKQSHRGRRLIGGLLVLGIGAALVGSEKVRQAITGRRPEPRPWEPRYSDFGNGTKAETPATTEQV